MFRLTYVRYVVASAGALALDMAVFLGALSLGMPPILAAAAGYMSGLVLHWIMSSRAVFVGAIAAPGAQRRLQQTLFVGSAVVGLGTTMAVVGAANAAGLDPRLGKLIAVAVSFQLTYVLRKKFVFA